VCVEIRRGVGFQLFRQSVLVQVHSPVPKFGTGRCFSKKCFGGGGGLSAWWWQRFARCI